MATYDGRKAPGRAKPRRKKKVSPIRNVIGLALVVVLFAVAYLEWDANRRASASIQKLKDAMSKEQGLLSKERVEDILGRKPDGQEVAGAEAENQYLVYTYTWKGVFRKYSVAATYSGKFQPSLLRIE
jgi:hypothetical protein